MLVDEFDLETIMGGYAERPERLVQRVATVIHGHDGHVNGLTGVGGDGQLQWLRIGHGMARSGRCCHFHREAKRTRLVGVLHRRRHSDTVIMLAQARTREGASQELARAR